MRITISNNIKIENPTNEILKYCNDKLTISNPDYLVAKKMGRYCGNIEKELKLFSKVGNSLILPFGTFSDVWNLSDIETVFKKDIHNFIGNNMTGNIELYDYQKKALNRLTKGKNGVLEAPCGSGKTQIGLQLIKEIKGRALWLTHTKKLLEQSKARCELYFKGDFGTITEGEVNIGKDITFATVQTMSKIDVDLYKDAFDMVIVDECHHCVGSPTKVMQFYKVVSNCSARYKYGLSATLERNDGMIETLYSIIGKKLHTITKEEIGEKIIKSNGEKVDINISYNKSEYLNYDGTLNYTKLIGCLSNNEERNKIIVNKVFDVYMCPYYKHKQLILCHRVNQVEYLSREISKFCKVNTIIGKIKNDKRSYDGDVIIATYSLAKEGLDIPDLDVLHLATPQKDEATTIQAVGRIERNIKGKITPTYYDYVDVNIDYCNNCYKIRNRILKKNK